MGPLEQHRYHMSMLPVAAMSHANSSWIGPLEQHGYHMSMLQIAGLGGKCIDLQYTMAMITMIEAMRMDDDRNHDDDDDDDDDGT